MPKTSLFQGNLLLICLAYLLSGIALGMLRVNLQPFVLSLGASMTFVGVLEAIGGLHGLMATFAQPISGQVSDKKGRKVFLILGNLFALNALGLIIMAYYFNWMLLIIAMISLGLFTGISIPARDSAIAESVEANNVGVAYSVLMVFTMIPGLFAPLVGGYLSYNFGYIFLFCVCLILQASSLPFIFLTKETLRVRRMDSLRVHNIVRSFLNLRMRKEMKRFYFIIALDTFSWGVGSAILLGLLSKTFKFSTFQLGMLSSISSLSAICFQLLIGILIQRFGCKIFMFASEFVGVILMVGWLTVTAFESFATLHVLMGIVIATWAPAIRTLIANNFPEENRAEALGKLAFFGGLAGFPAPYIGGFLYDSFGFKAPIFVGLVGVILAIIFIVFWVPKRYFTEKFDHSLI
ncbi:MAG: MFS transporter [Candidatus Bathyarchaeia archaeon]